jgi:hypothetical protein
MRRQWLVWTCCSLWALCLLGPDAATADAELSAEEIMHRVDDRDDGDRSDREIEMILIDKNDNRRVRRIRSYSRDVGEDIQTIMFFLEPADVRTRGSSPTTTTPRRTTISGSTSRPCARRSASRRVTRAGASWGPISAMPI